MTYKNKTLSNLGLRKESRSYKKSFHHPPRMHHVKTLTFQWYSAKKINMICSSIEEWSIALKTVWILNPTVSASVQQMAINAFKGTMFSKPLHPG